MLNKKRELSPVRLGDLLGDTEEIDMAEINKGGFPVKNANYWKRISDKRNLAHLELCIEHERIKTELEQANTAYAEKSQDCTIALDEIDRQATEIIKQDYVNALLTETLTELADKFEETSEIGILIKGALTT